MGPNALRFFHSLARKGLTKNRGSGITEIADRMAVESEAASMMQTLVDSGLPLEKFDQFIKSEADVLKFLNIIKNAKPVSTTETASGIVIPFKQKRTFKEEIEAMKKSGDVVDPNNLKKNDNVLQREMFKNSNLNKPTIEGQMEKITKASNRIDEIKKEQAEMYRPKTDAEIKAKFDKQNQESIQRFKDKMKKDEPDDMATGGRAGYYTGGMIDVEPNLSDIGHGSDSLMARTRLVSPGNQATTSTGLNYLLAEDNDNIRIPFSDAGFVDEALAHYNQYLNMRKARPPKKRYKEIPFTKFFEEFSKENRAEGGRIGFSTGKLAGGIGSAIKKNKNLEESIDNKKMTDFLNKYYEDKAHGPFMTPMPVPMEDVMQLDRPSEPEIKVGPFVMEESNIAVFDDGTVYYKDTGEFYNDEGQVDGPSPGAKLKVPTMEAADGGRIGFAGGGGGRREFLKFLATLGGGIAGIKSGILGLGEGTAKKAITETVKQSAGSGYPPPYFFKLVEKIKFMGDDVTEKAATQERQIVKRYKDYEMTEDVATGDIVIKKRNEGSFYDQDGIISDEYIVYKPGQADELTKGKKPPAEYEEYTVRPDAEGKLKDSEGGLDSIDEILEEVGDPDSMTLKKADGGRIGFSGGGIYRAIIANSAKKAGMKPYEYIRKTSYKSLPPEIKIFMSKADFEKLKMGQEQMYGNYIDMAKTRLDFQKQIEGGKKTPARELFEGMEKTMDEQSYVPKNVNEKDIGEMEIMFRNRFHKGRKDNARGGLQTMLGE